MSVVYTQDDGSSQNGVAQYCHSTSQQIAVFGDSICAYLGAIGFGTQILTVSSNSARRGFNFEAAVDGGPGSNFTRWTDSDPYGATINIQTGDVDVEWDGFAVCRITAAGSAVDTIGQSSGEGLPMDGASASLNVASVVSDGDADDHLAIVCNFRRGSAQMMGEFSITITNSGNIVGPDTEETPSGAVFPFSAELPQLLEPEFYEIPAIDPALLLVAPGPPPGHDWDPSLVRELGFIDLVIPTPEVTDPVVLFVEPAPPRHTWDPSLVQETILRFPVVMEPTTTIEPSIHVPRIPHTWDPSLVQTDQAMLPDLYIEQGTSPAIFFVAPPPPRHTWSPGLVQTQEQLLPELDLVVAPAPELFFVPAAPPRHTWDPSLALVDQVVPVTLPDHVAPSPAILFVPAPPPGHTWNPGMVVPDQLPLLVLELPTENLGAVLTPPPLDPGPQVWGPEFMAGAYATEVLIPPLVEVPRPGFFEVVGAPPPDPDFADHYTHVEDAEYCPVETFDAEYDVTDASQDVEYDVTDETDLLPQVDP